MGGPLSESSREIKPSAKEPTSRTTDARKSLMCAGRGPPWVGGGGPGVRVCPFPSFPQLSADTPAGKECISPGPTHHPPAGPRAAQAMDTNMSLFLGGCPGASGCPQTAQPSAARPWQSMVGPWSEATGALLRRPSHWGPSPFSSDLGHHDLHACLVTRACSGYSLVPGPGPRKRVLLVHPLGHHSSTSHPVSLQGFFAKVFLSGGERTYQVALTYTCRPSVAGAWQPPAPCCEISGLRWAG